MRRLSLILALVIGTTLPIHASATGVDSSGGGNELIAAFVANAEALLKKIDFPAAHKQALANALRESRITSTKILKDAKGLAVPEQTMTLAYSSPGLIQLKEADANGDSWEQAVREKRPVAHIIIHELFRASGLVKNGRSVDDTFQLSVLTYKLNQVDNLGYPLTEPVELHYWKCQCFEGRSAGSPDGGMNLVDISTLAQAERRAQRSCREDLGALNALARCLKFVGDPNQL